MPQYVLCRGYILYTVLLKFNRLSNCANRLRIEAQKAPSGVGYGEGISPPHPITGMGKRRKLPQRGMGALPRPVTHFGVL